ncbi:conserved hypothetical protein [Tenacibaculum sp. 190524A05c]|uniref:hypothetical protein n=1 Tax=Tenacibaculum platacis TaxID=3137852 RepID=UPI0031FB46AE
MKNLLFLFFFLCCIDLIGQNINATIHLRDGSTLEGIVAYTNNLTYAEYLYFKKDKNSKKQKLNYKKVDKFFIHEDGENKEYQFKILKHKKPKIFRVVKRGLVSLYYRVITSGVETNLGSQNIHTHLSISKFKEYYISKEDSHLIEQITFPTSFAREKKFRDKVISYFKDCHTLTNKIKKEEFKMDDIIQVVNYYIYDCQLNKY